MPYCSKRNSWTHPHLNNSQRNAEPLITAVCERTGQGSRKISGHTTANSCDIRPKLLANNTVEFADNGVSSKTIFKSLLVLTGEKKGRIKVYSTLIKKKTEHKYNYQVQ